MIIHLVDVKGLASLDSIENSKELIKDEIGDIFFVLTCLCNQMDIDIKECILNSLDKKTKRDSDRHKKNKKLTNK